MSDISNLSNLAGANTALARNTSSGRPAPPEPATVQQAVAQPLTTPQSSVTQSPRADGAAWQRNTRSDGHQPQPGAAPTHQQVNDTINHLNQRLRHYNTALEFEMDDQYDKMVVRIVDRDTQEVVRQIPSEKTLALAQFFNELDEQQGQESFVALQNSGDQNQLDLKLEGLLFQAKV